MDKEHQEDIACFGCYSNSDAEVTNFILHKDVGRCSDVIRTNEHKLTGTWDEFEASSDQQYVSEFVRPMKWYESFILVQGDTMITEHKKIFLSLVAFASNINLLEATQANMFEGSLNQ